MAQAILLKEVAGLGEAGSIVEVSPGYLRNYLGPRKLAQPATEASIRAAKDALERTEKAEQMAEDKVQEQASLLSKTVLTISHQAGEDGRLFGSVTAKEIADAVRQARGIKLDRRKIKLEEPIRDLGTHMVEVEVTPEVTATIKTMIVAE